MTDGKIVLKDFTGAASGYFGGIRTPATVRSTYQSAKRKMIDKILTCLFVPCPQVGGGFDLRSSFSVLENRVQPSHGKPQDQAPPCTALQCVDVGILLALVHNNDLVDGRKRGNAAW